MKYLKLFFVLTFLLSARSVWATCTGFCVQESTVTIGTGGTAPNPTLGANTHAGNAILAVASTSSGNTQPTVSGMGVTTWTDLCDSGNSTSSGNRTILWCGIVATPGTSLTFSGQATSTGYLQETSKKGCNIATANGLCTGSFAASGTSVSSFNISTLSSSAMAFSAVTHRTNEAVTDGTSLTPTNKIQNTITFNGDYGAPNGTTPITYSWTTSSANAWFGTAFDDQCTGNDACKQMAPGVHSSGAANLVVTLQSTASVGQAVIVRATQGVGNATITVAAASGTDVYASGWKLIGDTGNSGAGGIRTFTYCGIATAPGTTVTMTVSGGGGTGIGMVVAGYSCTVDKSAEYNSGTGGVTSTTIGSINTVVANDLIIGGASHGHAEAQTDGSSGFRPLIPYTTTSPAVSMNYQVASGTGTYTVNWSWTTSAIASGDIIALEPGNTTTIAYATTLLQRFVPVSLSTPVPPTTPNQGAFYKGTQGNNQRCPTNLGTGVVGCSLFFKWAQLEPQNGNFDWAAIKYALNNSSATSHPANYPIQVEVLMGDGGVPDSEVVCHSYGPPPTEQNPPTCIPWLASVQGVNTHWRAGAVDPGVIHGGIMNCQPTYNAAPWDTTYQSALATFEAAFNAQFAGTNVKLISLNVVGPDGHNMGLDTSIASQTCPDWSASNFYTTNTIIKPGANNSGGYNFNETVDQCQQGATPPSAWPQSAGAVVTDGTGPTACSWTNLGSTGTFTEYYNNAWKALAATNGCTSTDPTTLEACWVTLVTGGVDTMIAAQAAAIPSIVTSYWIQASNWPSITGGNGSTDPDTNPQGIQQTVFNYAQAHQSAAGYYVINEALKNTSFSSSLIGPWISSPNTARGGVQMLTQLSTSGNCGTLCGALLPCGGCAGVGFAQIYVPDLTNCQNTLVDYNEVVSGDALHLCQAVGSCTSGITCTY